MSLIQAIRKLAAEYPDAKYPKGDVDYCQYTVGECGPGHGCIIGQALQSSGMEDKAYKFDRRGESPISCYYEDVNISNTNDKEWLTYVQSFQDRGMTWSKSVKAVDELIGG